MGTFLASLILSVMLQQVDPHAVALLERMCRTLSSSSSIVVTARIEREQLDQSGQMLNSYVTTMAAVKRPNLVYTATVGDGRPYATWYDGALLTVYVPSRNAFDQTAYTGDQDLVLRKVSRLRDGDSPVAPFLSADPYGWLGREIAGARIIGDVLAGDMHFRQIAFTGADIDWQLWITLDDDPLPARMAVLFKHRPGKPRLVVEFQRWDLGLDLDSSTFYFKPPPDARPASYAWW